MWRFSRDGRTIASASWDGTVRLWDAVTGAPKRTLTGHIGFVLSVTFGPDGRTIASASYEEVRLWDAVTGAHKRTLTGHTGSVTSIVVAFSPDDRTLASSSEDSTVLLWELTPSANATPR